MPLMRIAVIILAVVLQTGWLVAESPADPTVRSRIERGMERSIRNDFAGAEAMFRDLIADYPMEPFGYFYLGATLQARMLDAESYDAVARFESLMDSTIRLAEAARERRGAESWLLFYEGSAHLYRSFMDSKMGRYWGAYRHATRGVERLERIVAADPTFYDAYLGIGSFKYWKSRKASALTWLPFIADDREAGIAMVETAVAKGRLVPLVARDQLVWMLLDAERYAEALDRARVNYRAYPESRFFAWTLVEACTRAGEWGEAEALYRDLLAQVRAIPGNNHYNETTCLLRLAEIHGRRRDYREAVTLLDELLALPVDPALRERLERKRERAEQLRRQCLGALAARNPEDATGAAGGARGDAPGG